MKLFFREFGEGKPFIILHGLFGLSDNWVSIAKVLAQNYHVIIPDLRNHGQSPHSPVFNYDAMTSDIIELMDDLDLEQAVILGHSMGGKVAMQFALQNPELTEKLIVVDMSMRRFEGRQLHSDIIQAMMSIDFNTIESRTDVNRQLATTIHDERVRLFILKNLYRKTRYQLDWRLNLSDINQNIDYVFDGISSNTQYNGPALFIKGEKSDYILDSDIPKIVQCFPKAIFQTVSGAGHWVQADNPEGFLEKLAV
jgi:pimeloyl-ACP methyl ester carboxylesterase